MPITQNPTIDYSTNLPPQLFYLDDAVAVGESLSNPNNLIMANAGSIMGARDGSGLYYKTTDNVATGWIALGAAGGGSPGGAVNTIQYNAGAGVFGGVSGVTTNGTVMTFASNALNAANINDNAGLRVIDLSSSGPVANNFRMGGAVAGGTPNFQVIGTDTNVGIQYQTQAQGVHQFSIGAARFQRSAYATPTVPYAVKCVTPADTAMTASTESIPFVFGGTSATPPVTVTRQWSAGAIATQRENLFVGPTYAFTAGSTITTAATLAIDAAPIQGANCTITEPLALFVQSGNSRFTPAVDTYSIIRGTEPAGAARFSIGGYVGAQYGSIHLGQITPSANNYTMIANASTETIINNATATAAIKFRLAGAVSPDLFILDGNQSNSVGINTSGTISAQLHVISSNTGRQVIRADSATGATVEALQVNETTNQTAIVANAVKITMASSGTPANGFGGSILWTMQSDTTANRNAFLQEILWATATDASRKARTRFMIYDTLAREACRMEASGSAPMIGFLGANAAIQQTGGALTAAATYGANEQSMLNKAYTCLQTFGLLS